MKVVSRAVARRYARALLEVARDKKLRGKATPEELRGELEETVQLLQAYRELTAVLTHPAVSTDKKKKIAAALWGKGRASELFLRLLDLLVSRDRMALLPAIAEAFGELWNAERGVITADAVSAVALEGRQLGALKETLGRVTGLTVELRGHVDPSLIGGLLVRMGGKTYDGTVRTQLKALRQRLVGG